MASLRKLLISMLLAVAATSSIPAPALADPADIDAAARGVVRIIIINEEGDRIYPVSHGTGFAVSPERIVTNAHVVAEAQADRTLSIGIIPSDGGDAVYGRLVSYSPKNDLALIATTSPLRLPPLSIASDITSDAAPVTSVGYPMNVDRAQGLDDRDIFRAQPPVKSRGFLSGRRPTREFDTILHTAPIARGSSGGPLLDSCGRVIGVNSFGAESDGADAEFYFAVSTRELLPFLRAANITPQVNGLPCRSLAELDAEERDRTDRALLIAREAQLQQETAENRRADQLRRDISFQVIGERENSMGLAMLLLIAALAAAAAAWQARLAGQTRKAGVAAAIAGLAAIVMLIVWATRPGFEQVELRTAQSLKQDDEPDGAPTGIIKPPSEGELICVVDVKRSRITGAKTDDIPFSWDSQGCVNARTQYGLMGETWSRIFVPNQEAVVSVNSYDPDKREYRVERYLLGREAIEAARQARADYQAPGCGSDKSTAIALGTSQAAITALLPAQPNERLVYDCRLGT